MKGTTRNNRRGKMAASLFNGVAALLLLATANGCFLWETFFPADEDDPSELLALALLAGACIPYAPGLPANTPLPPQPAENCTTVVRAELGRHLFYDRRLSGDQSMSCASCHLQQFAFTTRDARPRGIPHAGFPLGEEHPRNSQSLANVGYFSRLTWANSTLTSLEVQAAGPLFADSGPSTIVELGLLNDDYLNRLNADPLYAELFRHAYGSAEVSESRIRRALASFQRTLFSFNSPYDRFVRGDSGAISASAVRGASVFNGEVAECFHCHGGFTFSDSINHPGLPAPDVFFHNNGIYLAADYAARPMRERGLIDVTGLSSDEGRFKAPSLRNVGLTFPYMHDGSFACDPPFAGDADACARNALQKTLNNYMNGGKRDGMNQPHPTVDPTLIRPFTLTAQEQQDMIEFLMSLNDTDFTNNPLYSNPRPSDPNFGP